MCNRPWLGFQWLLGKILNIISILNKQLMDILNLIVQPFKLVSKLTRSFLFSSASVQ